MQYLAPASDVASSSKGKDVDGVDAAAFADIQCVHFDCCSSYVDVHACDSMKNLQDLRGAHKQWTRADAKRALGASVDATGLGAYSTGP